MGCITKHYLNEFSILGVWKIEEDLDTLLDLLFLIMMKRRNIKDSAATPGNLNF